MNGVWRHEYDRGVTRSPADRANGGSGHAEAPPAPGVNLIPPNTKFQDRWNQVDVSAKRTFKFGKKELQGQFAVFNDALICESGTSYSRAAARYADR